MKHDYAGNTNRSSWNPDASLINEELAPTPKEQRKWTSWSYAAVWMGIVHNVSQWVITANLIEQGMSFWQAMSVTFFAFVVIYVALILNSVCGAKYGIPFPVIIRSAFGHKASLIPVFIRGVLGVFWFGVFMYIASESIDIAFKSIIPGWEALGNYHFIGMGLNTVIDYAISIILHFFIITHGIERIRRFELWAGPSIMVIALGLVFWAMNAAGGFKPLVSFPSTVPEGHFWSLFFLSATGIIGSCATLIVNIPDLSRFSRSQKDQLIGQGIGVPVMFIFFSFISVIVTAGTVIAFGKVINDPIQILARFESPLIVFIGSLIILASVLSLNAATNAVAVGFDLAALFPRTLNFSRAGVIAIVLGVLSVPWLWYGKTEMMNIILGALGSTMGPVAGIMLIDFYFIRKQQYDVNSFYVKDGLYSYNKGWNPRALLALVIGLLVAFSGLIIPSLNWLFSYNWFLGIGAGGLAYYILMSYKVKADQSVSTISDYTS